MRLQMIDDLCRRYGRDMVLLVGGALQAQDADMARATRAYMTALNDAAGG
jgi:hypothetical protein